MQTELLVDGRWTGQYGIARYAHELISRIPEARVFTSGPPPWHLFDSLYTSTVLARFRPRTYFSPGYNAPAIAGKSVVFTIHDLIHLHCEDKGARLKALYYNLVLKPAARRARCVITVSEYSRQEILDWAQLSPEQAIVVPNACSNVFSTTGPSHSSDVPYFFFIGAQKVHKNIERILRSFAASGLSSEIRFLFTGSPSQQIALWIKSLELSSSVTFVGRLPDPELAKYYRGALALIMPSLYEGFGLPVLEAMACGTPVLGSLTTAIPEVAGDAALLIDPYNLDAISGGMQRLANDSALRARLSAAGLRNAERFSWTKSASLARRILLN